MWRTGACHRSMRERRLVIIPSSESVRRRKVGEDGPARRRHSVLLWFEATLPESRPDDGWLASLTSAIPRRGRFKPTEFCLPENHLLTDVSYTKRRGRENRTRRSIAVPDSLTIYLLNIGLFSWNTYVQDARPSTQSLRGPTRGGGHPSQARRFDNFLGPTSFLMT